jgi:hypothetical protein
LPREDDVFDEMNQRGFAGGDLFGLVAQGFPDALDVGGFSGAKLVGNIAGRVGRFVGICS